MILIAWTLFWPKSEQYLYKIDVMCLFNYIIFKNVCPEQCIKRLIGTKSQQFGCILFLKLKFSFVHYKICWHLVVIVSVSVSLSIIIKVSALLSVSKNSKQYTPLINGVWITCVILQNIPYVLHVYDTCNAHVVYLLMYIIGSFAGIDYI